MGGEPGRGPTPASSGRGARGRQLQTLNRTITGIASGPDSSLYLADIGAWPYEASTGRIVRLDRDGTVANVWTGLVAPMAVAVADDGTLYTLEETAPARIGLDTARLLRRRPDGEVAALLTGLTCPTALTLGPDGHLYIAHNGCSPSEAIGELVQLEVSG
jgi:hypothetical protein